jgi:AcrR family transcriptional regulator
VSRWEPDARERLERAALDLFVEQGFTETTVPQITARAGLTTRTFHRHFADKREVLFAGEAELPGLVAELMAEAPAELSPMMVVVEGLQLLAAARFEGRRDQLRIRRAVVRSDDGLRERELRKLATLSEAITLGFRNRGVDELTATLTAQLAVTAFGVALARWLDQDDERPLTDVVLDTLEAIRSIAGSAEFQTGGQAADGR